jgi:hypothetical protein
MLDFDVDISELKGLFSRFVETTQKMPGFTGDVLGWLGGKYAIIMRNIINEIDYSGRLRESVGYEVATDKKSVEIGPNVPNETQDPRKIYVVWKGWPHAFSPPLQEILNWAQVKLGDRNIGYYVQKRIAGKYEIMGRPGGVSRATRERETPGFSFLERTIDTPEGQVLLEEAGVRIGKKLIANIVGDE